MRLLPSSSPASPSLRGSLIGGFVLALALPLVHTGCGDDRSPTFPNQGAGGSTGGRTGSGGLGGENGGGAAGSGSGGENGGTGGSALPTSCEGVECRLGTCDDSSGVATCECIAGFEYNGALACVDIDECFSGQDMCGPRSSCVNTNGSFYCNCDAGQSPTPSGGCADIDECASNPCAGGATCTNQPDGFTCACSAGLAGNGLFCQTDECAGNPCGAGNTCVNVPGGHVCQCASGSSGETSCTANCATVTLADPELEAAVREAIDKPTDTISAADVANLTQINGTGRSISNLAGLECIPSLETLLLSGTNVDGATLNVVRKLNRLRHLDLSCTPVENLGFVANHPTLERLDVNHGFLCDSNLDSIAGVTSALALKQLSLQGHGITSLAGFENLKHLQTLALAENDISDVSPLLSIPGLQQLYLADNQLTDLDDIRQLTLLRHLDVSSNPGLDLTGLDSLTLLESLNLDNLGLTALPDLSALTHLRTITFSLNQVTSLAPLAGLTKLHWIFGATNMVESVEPLVGTNFRGTLALPGNLLDCSTEKPHLDALIAQGVTFVGTMCP